MSSIKEQRHLHQPGDDPVLQRGGFESALRYSHSDSRGFKVL